MLSAVTRIDRDSTPTTFPHHKIDDVEAFIRQFPLNDGYEDVFQHLEHQDFQKLAIVAQRAIEAVVKKTGEEQVTRSKYFPLAVKRIHGVIGEILGEAWIRENLLIFGGDIRYLDEKTYHLYNKSGRRPDGLAYSINNEQLTIHAVLESKLGPFNRFNWKQAAGYLEEWASNGIFVPEGHFRKIYLAENPLSYGIDRAELLKKCLVVVCNLGAHSHDEFSATISVPSELSKLALSLPAYVINRKNWRELAEDAWKHLESLKEIREQVQNLRDRVERLSDFICYHHRLPDLDEQSKLRISLEDLRENRSLLSDKAKSSPILMATSGDPSERLTARLVENFVSLIRETLKVPEWDRWYLRNCGGIFNDAMVTAVTLNCSPDTGIRERRELLFQSLPHDLQQTEYVRFYLSPELLVNDLSSLNNPRNEDKEVLIDALLKVDPDQAVMYWVRRHGVLPLSDRAPHYAVGFYSIREFVLSEINPEQEVLYFNELEQRFHKRFKLEMLPVGSKDAALQP